MTDTSIIVCFGLIVLIALVVGAWRLVRMWNSPDGERYNRMNLHGFFDSSKGEERPTGKGQTAERGRL